MTESRLPRPFTMESGSGQIVEEARFEGDHAESAIQLMRFATGDSAGSYALSFCDFSRHGQFQRSPMMIREAEIDRLREAVSATPEIRELLLRIAGAD